MTADHDWRVKQIMENNNLNIRQAIDFIEKTEAGKVKLLQTVCCRK